MSKYKSIQPIGEYILLKPEAKAEQSKGGIVLPEKRRPDGGTLRGEVLQVGQGILLKDGYRQEPTVYVGQTVVYEMMTGVPIEENREEYILVKESDILAVFE